MQLEKYLALIQQMDQLIFKERTGPPGEFARKLHLSERRTRAYIEYLKDLGAPITYCRRQRSYIYRENGRFIVEFGYRKDAT